MLEIAESATVSKFVDIEDSVRGNRLVVGEKSRLDAFVKVWFVGGDGDIVIGTNSHVNAGSVIYSGNGVRIGDNVLIAANCTLAPVNHEYHSKDQRINQQRFLASKGGILIEDDVWIGAGSVILDGAILRKGCVIGALSLVRGEVPAYSVNVGNPLKLIGQRD